MARRHNKLQGPMSPLYVNDYGGFLADSAIFMARAQGAPVDSNNPWSYLTEAQVRNFADKIRAARHEGLITQREADNLLVELHGGNGTHTKPRGRKLHYVKRRRMNGRRRSR